MSEKLKLNALAVVSEGHGIKELDDIIENQLSFDDDSEKHLAVEWTDFESGKDYFLVMRGGTEVEIKIRDSLYEPELSLVEEDNQYLKTQLSERNKSLEAARKEYADLRLVFDDMKEKLAQLSKKAISQVTVHTYDAMGFIDEEITIDSTSEEEEFAFKDIVVSITKASEYAEE